VYEATQSSIHVLVTHAFLRSLATLDLADSRVGRLAPQPHNQLESLQELDEQQDAERRERAAQP
jgi:hypothetical protein